MQRSGVEWECKRPKGQGAKKGNIGMLFLLDVPTGSKRQHEKNKERGTVRVFILPAAQKLPIISRLVALLLPAQTRRDSPIRLPDPSMTPSPMHQTSTPHHPLHTAVPPLPLLVPAAALPARTFCNRWYLGSPFRE